MDTLAQLDISFFSFRHVLFQLPEKEHKGQFVVSQRMVDMLGVWMKKKERLLSQAQETI